MSSVSSIYMVSASSQTTNYVDEGRHGKGLVEYVLIATVKR